MEAPLGAADGGEEEGVAGGGDEGRVGQTGSDTVDAVLECLREEGTAVYSERGWKRGAKDGGIRQISHRKR